jgi:hypothetical protein
MATVPGRDGSRDCRAVWIWNPVSRAAMAQEPGHVSLDSSYQTIRQIVRDYDINRLLFGRDTQGTAHDTEFIILYAYFFVLSWLLIVALAKILRRRKSRVSGQQTSG